MKDQKKIVECLSCGENVCVGRNQKLGMIITCDHCDSQFIVVELDPLTIDWPDFDEFLGAEEDIFEDFEPYDDTEPFDDIDEDYED